MHHHTLTATSKTNWHQLKFTVPLWIQNAVQNRQATEGFRGTTG